MIRNFPLLSLILEHKQHECSTDRMTNNEVWSNSCGRKLWEPVRFVEEWVGMSIVAWTRQKFTNGWKHSKEGRPLLTIRDRKKSPTITCAEVEDQIDQYIPNNRKIDIYNIVSEMNTNHRRRCCKSELGGQTKHPNVTIQHTYGAMDQLQLRTDTKCVSSPWTEKRTMVLCTFLLRLPHRIKMHDKVSLAQGGIFQRHSSSLPILQSTHNNHNGISRKDDNCNVSRDGTLA